MNAYGVPGITVEELAQKQEDGDEFILLDVREPYELVYATLINGAILVPMSDLAQKQFGALPPEVMADKEAEILVMCHHGSRSAQVTAWLRQNGWTNVWNVEGGIEAYAIVIDPDIGRY